jgi:hypothetical protein
MGRGATPKASGRRMHLLAELERPPRGMRHVLQGRAAGLTQGSRRPPVELIQHPLARQHGHRHDTLPLGCHHGQCRHCTAQRYVGVHVWIIAGQSDHRRYERSEAGPSVI